MKLKFIKSSNIGMLTILMGILLLWPLIITFFYPEDLKYIHAFIIPAVFSIVLGLIICLISYKRKVNFNEPDLVHFSTLTVLYAWSYGFIIGAIPFIIANLLNPIQALFEAVSGWTTTGLSVMDVTITPHIFLFFRSFMQFCGGLGFVMVMILLIQSKYAMHLYNAEGHPDKIMPNLRETVRVIFLVYVGSFVVGVIAYVLVGMPLFDSIIHTMGALSTGGFSNQIDSIGAYNSIKIEAVTISLMLIGTTNFATILLLIRGKFKQALMSSELKFMFLILIFFIPLMAISFVTSAYSSFSEGLRISLFNITSALSTSGYATVNYQNWPEIAVTIMILMMLIGGGLGSTAGGIKLSRVLIILKSAWHNVLSRIRPEHEIKVPSYYRAQGKTEITDELVKSTSGFITCYLIIFIFGSMALTLTENVSIKEAMFEFASSLSTVGLSIGITNPDTNSATLIIEIMGMILGRLEIFIVLTGIVSTTTLFSHYFKRKNRAKLLHY